jgi:hypothetical protein
VTKRVWHDDCSKSSGKPAKRSRQYRPEICNRKGAVVRQCPPSSFSSPDLVRSGSDGKCSSAC